MEIFSKIKFTRQGKSFLSEPFAVILAISLLLCLFFYDIIFLGKTFKATTANPQALKTGVYGQENNRPPYFPMATTDVTMNEEPTLAFIRESLRDGILPLWNPHLGCGYPLIAQIQVGLFYPLNLMYYILPDIHGWDFLILSRMFLAGLFMYWLMRSLKYSKPSSACAMIMFMLGRPSVVLHAWMVNVDILLPLLLISIEFLREQRRRSICFVAFVVGLSCFAGHPEHIVLIHGVGILFFLFRLVTVETSKSYKIFAIKLFKLFLAYIIGAGLASVVIFPFLQNWVTEFWHAHPDNMGQVSELAGVKYLFLSLLYPNFLQKFPVGLRFDSYAWWGSVGILPFGLAFLGLLRNGNTWALRLKALFRSVSSKDPISRKPIAEHESDLTSSDRLQWFFAGIALAVIIKVFFNPPLFQWLCCLPVIRYIRFSNHTSHLFLFAVAFLSGIGMQVILTQKNNFLKFSIFALFCFTVMKKALMDYSDSPLFNNAMETSLVSAGIILAFMVVIYLKERKFIKGRLLIILIFSVIGFELLQYVPRGGYVNKFDSFPRTPYIEFIRNRLPRSRVFGIFWSLLPNTSAAHRIDDLGIYHNLLSKRFVGYVNNFIVPDYYTKDFTRIAFWVIPITFNDNVRKYFDIINVRYSVAPNPLKKESSGEILRFPNAIYSKEVNIYEHPKTMPRAYVIHRVIFKPVIDDVVKWMKARKDYLGYIAVVQRQPDEKMKLTLRRAPVEDNSTVKIEKYFPNEVILEADMENPGLVVLADMYHPDWKAFVDDEPAEIFITDYMLRSVYVGKGKHRIRFVFRPFSFYLGCGVSFASLIILLAIFWLGDKRCKNKQ